MVHEHQQCSPAPQLRSHVRTYQGYRSRGEAPAVHRGLPSPWLTLIITLDEPLVLAERRAPYDVLLGGLHATPTLVVHDGAQSGIQVGLDPLAARAVLGLPAGELAELDLDAGVVLGPVAVELQDRVRAAPTWGERFAAVDRVLCRRADSSPAVAPEVARAWQQLRRTGGRAPVAGLAAEVGWSERHLARRFQAEVGLAPKAAARVVRFDAARRRLQAAPGLPLATLASDAGYCDQAHLSREWGVLAGCPPGTWLREEVGNVQDPPSGDEEGGRHDS